MAQPSFTWSTLAGPEAKGPAWNTDATGTLARFDLPRGVALDSNGNIYVADGGSGNNLIRRVTASGVVTTIAGSRQEPGGFRDRPSGTGDFSRFNRPSGIAIGPGVENPAVNVFYVADALNHRIRVVSLDGQTVRTLAGNGTQETKNGFASTGDDPTAPDAARFSFPQEIAVTADGRTIYVSQSNGVIRRLQRVPNTLVYEVTTFVGTAGQTSTSVDGTGAAARFRDPGGLALDAQNNLYVTDMTAHVIRKVTPAGVVTTVAGIAGTASSVDGPKNVATFNRPTDIVVDKSGNLFVTEQTGRRVRMVTPAGNVSTVAGDGTDGFSNVPARFSGPTGIAIDAAGNLYVADGSNSNIRKGTAPPPIPPTITSAATARGMVGDAFSYTITTGGGFPTSLTATGLPAGLTFNSTTGVISGTPTAAGVRSVSLTAGNSKGTARLTLALTISAASVPAVTSAATATGNVGSAFTYNITASPGIITAFAATGLPAGLTINTATGVISGTPTTEGTTTIKASASNRIGTGPLRDVKITVLPRVPTIDSATTATARVGDNFLYRITTSTSGGAPTSFAATGLPAGLTLNATTGVITGRPTSAGSPRIVLTASNAGGAGAPRNLDLTVNPRAPSITSASTAIGTVGVRLTYRITTSGGTPTSFAVVSPSVLPAGLSLNTVTGEISGTPTSAGASTVRLSASNAGGTRVRDVHMAIVAAAPVITSAATANGKVGTAFSYSITTSGGTPLNFDASALPAGLTINNTTGVISGTPVAPGTSTVKLSADNSGGAGLRDLVLTVAP